MKVVRFRSHWGSYNGGEVAGLDDAQADELVASGVAAPLESTKQASPPEDKQVRAGRRGTRTK